MKTDQPQPKYPRLQRPTLATYIGPNGNEATIVVTTNTGKVYEVRAKLRERMYETEELLEQPTVDILLLYPDDGLGDRVQCVENFGLIRRAGDQ